MLHAHHDARLTLGTPATYRIRVQGRLDESWSERLGGLRITTSYQGDQVPVSALVGTVKDQAELIGILNSLYDLRRRRRRVRPTRAPVSMARSAASLAMRWKARSVLSV
jgi:hypothetical protein